MIEALLLDLGMIVFTLLALGLARALEFYDRWLPGTMRRITDITRGCMPQCATLRSPGDWTARPPYR